MSGGRIVFLKSLLRKSYTSTFSYSSYTYSPYSHNLFEDHPILNHFSDTPNRAEMLIKAPSIALLMQSKSVHHILSNLRLPALCSFETVRVGLVVEHSLVDTFLGGLDKGAVLDDFLV